MLHRRHLFLGKGRGEAIGPTKRGEGVKGMAVVDRYGLSLQVSAYAADHHEVTLMQLSFGFYRIEAKPENLTGDRACDSDELDGELKKHGAGMIVSHPGNRRKRITRDGTFAAAKDAGS